MKKLMVIVLCAFMLGCTPKEQYKLDYVTDGTISEFTEITDKEPSIKEISLPSAITFFENKYSGVMVFAKPDSRYSQKAFAVLNQAAKDAGVTVYYVDVSRKFYKTDEEFMKYREKVEEFIDVTYLENPQGGGTSLYIPDVMAVKNGRVVDFHVGVLDDYDIDVNPQMTEEQYQKIYNIYADLIKITTAKDSAK